MSNNNSNPLDDDLANMDEIIDPLQPQSRGSNYQRDDSKMKNNYMNDSRNLVENESSGSIKLQPQRMSAAGRGAQPVSGSQANIMKSQEIRKQSVKMSNYSSKPIKTEQSMEHSFQNMSLEENRQLVESYKSENFGEDSDDNELDEGQKSAIQSNRGRINTKANANSRFQIP